MSTPKQRSLVLLIAATAAIALLVVFVARHGFESAMRVPAWTKEAIKMKILAPEQDASSGGYYNRTASTPLSLATIVREMRAEWPTESVSIVHRAALEVGTALLHRGDIEIGEIAGGSFLPRHDLRWDANARMVAELEVAPTFFTNEQVYVFRRK